MLNTKELWDNVLVELEQSLSKANFATWFRDTHILKIDDGVVYLGVPNQFVKDWLASKYHKQILKSVRALFDTARSLEYAISKNTPRRHDTEVPRKALPQLTPAAIGELPLSEYYINKDNNLNPRYTLDSFVVGSFNELAHAAAQAIIKRPGISYNPLFIYGDTGVGKTHLIQAIGNSIKHMGPDKKVLYVTSEKFLLDYVTSLQNNKTNAFKEKYRQYDVLIMDDIQFFSKKEKIQEELFHLFNTLYDNNKQIIFSSDQHPNMIQSLEERLKSRFSAGMIVPITGPDHESRVAILKTKAAQSNFILADDIGHYLADAVSGNIRELEGILNTIVCKKELENRELTLADVKALVKDAARPKRVIAPKDIIKTIADFYQVEEGSIYEKTRRKEVVKPRQIIMYILREDFHISYPTIGEKLGGRDHTTVIHSCEKVKHDLKLDSALGAEVAQIRAMLK